MKNKKYILFDLDGTLTDPYEGITKSAQYGLEKVGIIEDQENLKKIIGPPLKDAFMELYGLSQSDAETAIKYYRIRYADVGFKENFLYDGIEDCLKSLKKAGKVIILATSKPDESALKILELFGISQYFAFLSASTLDGDRNTKGKVIEYAIKSMCIKDISEAIMIGDRLYDIKGAKEFGMDSIGVLYGYGSLKELQQCEPTFLCESVTELKRLLLGID